MFWIRQLWSLHSSSGQCDKLVGRFRDDLSTRKRTLRTRTEFDPCVFSIQVNRTDRILPPLPFKIYETVVQTRFLSLLRIKKREHRQTLRPSSNRDPQQSPASFRSPVGLCVCYKSDFWLASYRLPPRRMELVHFWAENSANIFHQKWVSERCHL